MVCCGISDSPLVSSHAYRLRSNRHRPFAKEVSQLVDEYESAAVKYLIERLNLKTVVDSMSAESLYHTPLRGMNLQYLRNNALRPLLLECLNDHCDSDQFDCHTPWEWVDPRLLR